MDPAQELRKGLSEHKGPEGRLGRLRRKGEKWVGVASQVGVQIPLGGFRLEVGRRGQQGQLKGAMEGEGHLTVAALGGHVSHQESTGTGHVCIPEPVWLLVSVGHTGTTGH